MVDRIELTTTIDTPPERVWAALTDPKLIKAYMMGATVATDWKVGHKITWSGSYQGHDYEDKGVVKAVEPNRRLSVTHWSPMSKLPDVPENYHTVTYELVSSGNGTKVTLAQDNLAGTTRSRRRRTGSRCSTGLKRLPRLNGEIDRHFRSLTQLSEERKEQILDALVAELQRQAGDSGVAISDGAGARRYRVNGEVDAIALATAIDAALGGDALEAEPAKFQAAPSAGPGSSPKGAYARADEGKAPEELNASNDE